MNQSRAHYDLAFMATEQYMRLLFEGTLALGLLVTALLRENVLDIKVCTEKAGGVLPFRAGSSEWLLVEV